MKFYHGTSSAHLVSIQEYGFKGPAYFTRDIDDAEYYAATGGEADLQQREEAYAKIHGVKARKHFYPDLWDMYEALYPVQACPIVIVVDIPEDMMKQARKDAGAVGGIVFKQGLSATYVHDVLTVAWPETHKHSY